MREIIESECFFCVGTGKVDYRYARPLYPHSEDRIDSLEVHGRLVDCPHCGGVGVVPKFKPLTEESE